MSGSDGTVASSPASRPARRQVLDRVAGDVPEGSADRAGQHRVDADTLRAQLVVQRLTEGQHVGLRGPVDAVKDLGRDEAHAMTLQIRDDRARELARKLAAKRHVTMTEAVIQALEAELRREADKEPLASRLKRIADELAVQGKPGGRAMTKKEIDEMWGH